MSINFSEILNSPFLQNFLKPLIITVGSFFFGKACIYLAKLLNSGYQTNVKPLWKKVDLVEKYGEYVIITNAQDPIGEEFAKEFARHGHSLILIRLKNDKKFDKVLPNIKKFIDCEQGREVRVITKDYDRCDRLIYADMVKELEKEEIKGKIGILLNNSGMGGHHETSFLNVDSMHVLNEIHMSVVDFLMVTKSVLNVMIENKRGLIVNVTTPRSHRSFTESGFPVSMRQFIEEVNKNIRRELSKCNVDVEVEALHPGRICDGENCCPNRLNPTPDQFVKSAFQVIGRVKSSTGYWSHSIEQTFRSFLPQFLAELGNGISKNAMQCGVALKQREYTPIPSSSQLPPMDAELEQSVDEELGH